MCTQWWLRQRWDETLILAASVSTRADIKFILLRRERTQKQIAVTRSFGSLSLISAGGGIMRASRDRGSTPGSQIFALSPRAAAARE